MHLCRLVNAGQTIYTAVDALVQVGERRSDHTYRSGCTCAGTIVVSRHTSCAGQTIIYTAVDALVQVGERRSDHLCRYNSRHTCAVWLTQARPLPCSDLQQ